MFDDFYWHLKFVLCIAFGLPLLFTTCFMIITIYKQNNPPTSPKYDGSELKEKAKIAEAVFASIVHEHIDNLGIEYFQKFKIDKYGVEDSIAWEKERDYFISKVLIPKAGPEYSNFFYRAKHMIDTAAAERAAQLGGLQFSENMEPLEFERWCAGELKKAGWIVTGTKSTGDQGADVIADKSGSRLVLQCKLYSSPVGNSAVQEAFSAKQHYGARSSAVVTNASFTRSARSLAATTGVFLLHHSQLETVDKLLGWPELSQQSPLSERIASSVKQNSAVTSTALDDLGARIEATKNRVKSTF